MLDGAGQVEEQRGLDLGELAVAVVGGHVRDEHALRVADSELRSERIHAVQAQRVRA